MAGDWIKMRADLFEHPKVFKLADLLGVDEFAAVGMLFCFWAWADKHAVDGRVDAATSRLVDKCARRTGFADALVSIGWLVVDADGISIPRFNEHNGDSAKERTLKNQRQARWRAGKRDDGVDAETSTGESTKATTREEKRREERNTPQAPKGEPEGFVAFWSEWPKSDRKEARGACLKAWAKGRCEGDSLAILEHIRHLKTSDLWTKDGGRFIVAPLVYLNQRRWEGADTSGGEARTGLQLVGAI